ncbi:unnamed protein product [Cercopithifilaria johnstoni]|uniref:Uncharacterized protein n=1 Tax=Cercopithifilaria johnstoni TaxID=2874296 RepID=A0A8J2LYB3_9BILA|nr:unnamed protein product [Cercopithifilaria johnstoni]
MQREVDDIHLQQILINITTTQITGDTIKATFRFWLKQFWVHLLLIIAFAFIFFLPINGLLYFCKQCCCKRGKVKRRKTKSFEILSCGYLILLIAMQAVMIGLLIVSLKSTHYIFNNANNINKLVQNISKDATNGIEIIFNNMKCEVEMKLPKLFGKMKYLLWQLPTNAFNHYKETGGYINMQSAINNLANANLALNKILISSEKIVHNIHRLPSFLQIKMANLTMMINDVINYIYQINKQNIFDEINALIDDTEKQTMKTFETIYNESINGIKFIRKSNRTMNNFYKNYIESQEFVETKNILYLLILIPVFTIIIPIIIVVFCGMVKLFTNDKSSEVFNCGRYFGLFALAGAFFTGWIVMLIASLSFIVGYSVEAFFNPLFHDSEMLISKSLPLFQFQFNIQIPIDNETFTIDIGNIIKRCKNNETILSVLEVERLINANSIMKKMNIEEKRERTIDTIKMQYFPEQFFNQFTEDFEELKEMNIELYNFIISNNIAELNKSLRDNFNNMNNDVSELVEIINNTTNITEQIIEQYLYSTEMFNESAQIIINESDYTIANIRKYIDDNVDYFQKNSYDCRLLYNIWEDGSLAISQKISRPIQGHWISTGLLALSFIPAIILIMLIIKFLATPNRKYDLNKQSRIDTFYGAIYAYEESPKSSTFTLASTLSNRSTINNKIWCKLFGQKLIAPMNNEPMIHPNIHAYDIK